MAAMIERLGKELETGVWTMTDTSAETVEFLAMHTADACKCEYDDFDVSETLRALAARLEEAECNLKNLQDRIEVKGGSADAPTQWAYEQACAALQHHKERAGVKDQQLHIARESLLSIAKCADDEDSQETAKNALVIMRALDPDQ